MAASCAERLSAWPQYSYRKDDSVPGFPDDRPLIVFDGICVLCSGFARFVAARDPGGVFRFAAAQSPLGQALFRHYGLDLQDLETNLLIENGRAYGKLESYRRIMARLGWPWRMLGSLAALPPAGVGERLYDTIARNRYRLFGRREACVAPDAEWRDRLIG